MQAPIQSLFCFPGLVLESRVEATWARGYKTFFMLNSVEHKILNAHKLKNVKKVGFF